MAGNALQFYKDSNQVIPLKLHVMVFIKDNIDKNSKSNEATKHFLGKSVRPFQSMKSKYDGIARYYNHNDIVVTVGDFC